MRQPEPGSGSSRPGETEKERLDRNLQDLLQGLRVALPGVQVLFAFLLILPFQSAFAEVTNRQEKIYFATLLLTALASVFLIAPSARHRMRFRKGDKRWVVLSGNRLSNIGFGCLGLAMTGAILLVTDFIFSASAALIAAGTILALLAWIWFGAPLTRSAGDDADDYV